jgi:hypothetical protein
MRKMRILLLVLFFNSSILYARDYEVYNIRPMVTNVSTNFGFTLFDPNSYPRSARVRPSPYVVIPRAYTYVRVDFDFTIKNTKARPYYYPIIFASYNNYGVLIGTYFYGYVKVDPFKVEDLHAWHIYQLNNLPSRWTPVYGKRKPVY